MALNATITQRDNIKNESAMLMKLKIERVVTLLPRKEKKKEAKAERKDGIGEWNSDSEMRIF